MWADADSLKTLSQLLLWGAVVCSILAAGMTGFRFYVDRRVNELRSIEQQKREEEIRQETRETGQKLESQISPVRLAVEPRRISPTQRATVLEILLRKENTSPKPSLKVLIDGTEEETVLFANSLKKLLVEAGYGKAKEKTINGKLGDLIPQDGNLTRRRPHILAVFSSPDKRIPEPSMPQFGSIMMMSPSTHSISRGDTSHPAVYRYTNNVNDILHGVVAVLRHAGFRVDPISGNGILRTGQVGFMVPRQI